MSARTPDASVSFRWQPPLVERRFRTGVSLHGHTHHSREFLDFIPRYANRAPLLAFLLERHQGRYRHILGSPPDYTRAWWTPPLSPREAWDVERKQIEDTLGLNALISLSDHDDITAGTVLGLLPEAGQIPISVEWTVPWGGTVFHLGVHNLPRCSAQSTMEQFAEFSARPSPSRLPPILRWLNEHRSTLIVLNHPLWDEMGVGESNHRAALESFLNAVSEWIHALELNGLRPWTENSVVLNLAGRWKQPLISGGDRHGCEPNAAVNLTRAVTLEEFISEVRDDRRSEILFLEQYRESYRLRILRGLLDVLRHYPEFPEGRRRWTDRVFFQNDDGLVKPLSAVLTLTRPLVVNLLLVMTHLVRRRRVLGILRSMVRRSEA